MELIKATLNYNNDIKEINEKIKAIPESISVGSISDRYHTFDELYHHRAVLFASLCMTTFKDKAWKSLLHHPDEEMPMYQGMFIVGVETPFGQATYHYDIDPYWRMFKVKELDFAPKFDGHTPASALDRIYKYAMKIAEESSVITKSITINDHGFYQQVPLIHTEMNSSAIDGTNHVNYNLVHSVDEHGSVHLNDDNDSEYSL